MADFRKCLLAFAVLALLSSLAVPASAQTTSALQCTFNAAVTPTVRVEGLTELLGDIVLNCTGGTATANGTTVPAANITVFLSNANITSRITANSSTASPFVETLLIVDEPHSASSTAPLTPCDPNNNNVGVCAITGTGSGLGTYSGTAARPNVFQGRLTGVNQVTFFGVPIDAPGTSGTRVIRITNLRANANMAGASTGSLVPQTITAFISVNPSGLLPLNNPQQTVAFVRQGLVTSVQSAVTFVQCVSQNSAIAASASTGTVPTSQFSVRFDEGFASAWKEKNIQVHLSNSASGTASAAYPGDAAQDVPGANYFSESGFEVNGIPPSGATPTGYGPFYTPTSAFTSTARGLNLAGVASAGTRIYINFGSVPNGTQIFLPTHVNLTNPSATSTTAATGFAVLTSADANGGGTLNGITGNTNNYAPVTISGGTGMAVYEILYTDPFSIERLSVPVVVAYTANAGNNLPQPSLQSTVVGGYAPISSVTTADSTSYIPRFVPGQTVLNSFLVNKCSCNILFPFVSNQQGFDTGIAIANTSLDPYGTTPQAGLVTLKYYNTGTPPPDNVTTSTVPAGAEVLLTLSGGGNYGLVATPGFQGYIIAIAQFQYCHAFAYISAQGALPTAPGASEGYLGIVLDTPFYATNSTTSNSVTTYWTTPVNRTGQQGEVQAH